MLEFLGEGLMMHSGALDVVGSLFSSQIKQFLRKATKIVEL